MIELGNGWHSLTTGDIPKKYWLRRIYASTVHHRFWLTNLQSKKYSLDLDCFETKRNVDNVAILGSLFFKRWKEKRMSGSKVEPIRKWSPHCITCLLGRLYQNISPSVIRKPLRVMSPSAFSNGWHNAPVLSCHLGTDILACHPRSHVIYVYYNVIP